MLVVPRVFLMNMVYLKLMNEVITYTGLTTNTFTGCIRGFSGITTYHAENQPNELSIYRFNCH